jgi:hypothetical protein
VRRNKSIIVVVAAGTQQKNVGKNANIAKEENAVQLKQDCNKKLSSI